MTDQQNLIDVNSVREAYSAPNYQCFAFETSGLAQMSGGSEIPESGTGEGTNPSSIGSDEW